MKSLIAAIGLALLVAGCATTGGVQNPLTSVDMYRVKNTYAATLELVVAWRNYCWSKSYAAIIADPVAKPVCENRRARLRTIQSAQAKAGSAVRYADNFIKANPTINIASVIGPAWDAVSLFQSVVPRVN